MRFSNMFDDIGESNYIKIILREIPFPQSPSNYSPCSKQFSAPIYTRRSNLYAIDFKTRGLSDRHKLTSSASDIEHFTAGHKLFYFIHVTRKGVSFHSLHL